MKKRWFFVLRKVVSRIFSGTFRSKKKGAGGIEFAVFREYQPGDPPRSISYPKSLQRCRYVVRDNMLDKAMSCLFLIDRSASTNFGPSGISKREIQNRLLNILAPAIAQNNNQVGFLITTDRLEKYFEPRFGNKLLIERLKLIEEFKPQSKMTDLNLAFLSVFRLKIPADLIFILSDFYTPVDFKASLKILSRKYDVIPMLLKDSFETTNFPKIPGGMIAFKDLETGEFFWGEKPQKISNVKLFKSLGLDYILLKTDENEGDWTKKLMITFEQRKKRRRIR